MADEFSAGEVHAKLVELGYGDITKDELLAFRRDLNALIKCEISGYSSNESSVAEHETERDVDSGVMMKPGIIRQKCNESGKISQYTVDKVKEEKDLNHGDMMHLTKYSSNRIHDSFGSNSSSLNVSHSSDQSTSQITNRKVMRRYNGIRRVFDETQCLNDSEASDITCLEEMLQQLPLKENCHDNGEQRSSLQLSESDSTKSSLRGYLPSYIYPSFGTNKLGRCQRFDPVLRYHQLKKEWKQRTVPGERKHQNTMWHIREQMLKREVYKRSRRDMKKNDYQVPTEKKRQSLRWEVRCALAKAD